MKCTKWGVLTILGLLALSGLTVALYASAADTSVDIKDDIKNAVQHIWTVKFINKSDSSNATLSQRWAGQVGVDTNNFLIIKSGDSTTKINGEKSSILWWEKNIVNASNAVILAWSWNRLFWAHKSTIIGWINNKSSAENSAIVWWSNNVINLNSTWSAIVWWDSNVINWKNSIILWKNNKIKWDYSVALWENSKLYSANRNVNNSFLWTDGSYSDKELSDSDVFAVISEWWMVVNTDTRNPLAKLTISGSLVVWENITKNSNIACWWWINWKWILKLVSKGDGTSQSCLCSCDWYSWNSLYWDGICAGVCNDEMSPKCGTSLSKIYLTESEFVYSWSCEEWAVIPKSYFVEWETIYWYCQTSDGAVSDKCSLNSNNVEVVETVCYPSTSSCGRGYKTWWEAWRPSYTCELNANKESCNCPAGKVWDGDACVYANKGGVCNNWVSNPSKDWCNIWKYKINGNANWTTWNCWDAGFKTKYNESLCYSCDENSVWDGNGCKKQSDICKPSSSSCNGWYTLSWWVAWWYNYYCKKSWSSDVTCTCPINTIWSWWVNKCVSIISDVCKNNAANTSLTWCSIWNYANVSEENWYVWNCKDGNGGALNRELCHKCDVDATWNGERCVKNWDICQKDTGTCGQGYELSWWVVWWYDYYCNKEWSEGLRCTCDLGKIWNWSECVSINNPCNTWAADVTSNWCSRWAYSWVEITNWYKWDCLDASWKQLNTGWVCYKCDNGFAWDNDSMQCVEIPDGKCTLSDAQHTVLADWESIEMYYDSEVTCPEICQKHVVTQCINWVISGSTNPWWEYEESCDTIWVMCTDGALDTCPEHWKCSSCTWYTFSDNVCTKWDVKRRLVSCDWWYTKLWNECVYSRDYQCLKWGGTWSVEEVEWGYAFWYSGNYYDSDWRILEEWIVPYYKTWTCWSTVSCSSKWYDCWWSFVPKQQYRRSYTIYAERWAEYHKCSNNSSLNYYTVTDREDSNTQYVVEDDDYTDATHQHWECWSNASEVCWDESNGLNYMTDNNWIAWYKTWSNWLRMLCENYWWDCSTWAQHPVNCDTCFFEVESLWKVSDAAEYGNPWRCDQVLPSSYMESNGVVDCWYRWRDIYCWNGNNLMHYSWVWGTEAPRDADWYAHTHTDTRYCWWAQWHKVLNAPNSYLCMKWTSNPVTHYNGNYQWICSYWGMTSSCWACEGWTEQECWSGPTNSCRAKWWCPETPNGWTCTTYYSNSPAWACTSITSTCNNWTWDKTPYDYSSCTQWCASVKWCSAAKNWASCTTYSTNVSDSCSSYSRTSVCNAWTWSQTPLQYSSCGWCSEEKSFNPSWALYSNTAPAEWPQQDMRCESDAWNWRDCYYENIWPQTPMCVCSRIVACKNCSASWACSATSHGGECTTYSSASPTWACTPVTSVCNNWTWSTSPYNYSSCTPWCSASWWCPASTNGSTCTTYSTGSSNACSSYRRTSTCNAWTWSQTPYSYSRCSKNTTSFDQPVELCKESCFLAGTQVTTKEWTKNIEDLQEWDMALSYNLNTEKNVYNKVVGTIKREVVNEELYELALEGSILKVTWSHRFYVVDENDWYQCSNVWKRAKELKVWDKLLKEDGSHVTIDWIDYYLYSWTVYNFEVEDTHGYYVGEWYLVHNIEIDMPSKCMKK